MEDLLEEVNRALRARGWSAQHASRQIGASPEFVRNLRRGYGLTIEKFRNLCEVLGLEFYVGPPREPGTIDERRMEEAIATLERVLLESDFILEPEDKASVVGAVYGFIGEGPSPATTARVKRLIAAMTGGRRSTGGESRQ